MRKSSAAVLLCLSLCLLPAFAAAKKSAPKKARHAAQVKKPVHTSTYFRLESYDGSIVDLDSFAGKSVLVAFITADCPYCKTSIKFLNSIVDKYAKTNAVIIVAMDENRKRMRHFAEEYALKMPLAIDGTDVAMNYGARGVPHFFLLDKNQVKVKVWPGFDDSYEAEIESYIKELAVKKQPAGKN